MNHRLIALLVACSALSCDTSTEPPDELAEPDSAEPDSAEPDIAESAEALVITNASIVTADAAGSRAEALAIRDGVIIAVGSASDVLEAAGADATVWDVEGPSVLPGFHDLHLHVPEAGLNEALCLLPPNRSASAYVELIVACATDQAGDGWVRAVGASLAELRDADPTPLEALDAVLSSRPVLVLDDLGHAIWTNSQGLAAAGIGADDLDPPGGVFHRDGGGRLTGLLLENAQHRVRDVALHRDAELDAALLVALDALARNGVTSASDAGGFWAQGHADAWQRAADRRALTVRASNSLYLYPDRDRAEQLAELAARFSDEPESLLRVNTVKVYLDGILDLGTAALVAPYDNPPDPAWPSGFRYFEQPALDSYAAALDEMGYRFHFHTVGDGAVRQALDTVAALPSLELGPGVRRHRTTHNYTVHRDDIPRFAALGVTADFQLGVGTGGAYADYLWRFIRNRANRLLPIRDLIDGGAHVTMSSDWDADLLSPLGILERSLTRNMQTAPDLASAIRMLTIEPARVLGQDDRVGSLEVGKLADIVILGEDLFSIPRSQIGEAGVLVTLLAGEVVYRARNAPI